MVGLRREQVRRSLQSSVSTFKGTLDAGAEKAPASLFLFRANSQRAGRMLLSLVHQGTMNFPSREANSEMCGIVGAWGCALPAQTAADAVHAMCAAIQHRGPDDGGVMVDESTGVGLGFRRLAILDLSPAGHQPMTSATGRYVIVFNGEIYNYERLRQALPNPPAFRGHSDTEVMLAAITEWGVCDAVERAQGMFAMAIWDRELRELHLTRDRLGEKPLYYARMGDTLLFGSELKALRAHPAWNGKIDRASLALFLRHNYVPAPHSIYTNTFKVRPGTIATFPAPNAGAAVHTYWSVRDVAERGVKSPLNGSDDEAIEALDALLRRVVSDEMVADVPLGAFLSGGVDSSALVALMQAQCERPVKTFTIGFSERGFDEAPYAAAVANHLGTDHTTLYVSPSDTLAVIPRLPTIYDEPFADSSQIPTFLVAQLARRSVTVSLSGEGGDELFTGYNRYVWGERMWQRMRRVPRPIRSAVGGAVTALSPAVWDVVFSVANRALPQYLRAVNAGNKVHKAAATLTARTPDELYRRAMTHWASPSDIAGAAEPHTALTLTGDHPCFAGPINRMRYFDLVSELPDDILVKVDRAAMAVSLESRAPYLHPDVVEFAWRIPPHQQVRQGEGKWLLRQVLYRYVPRTLIERPKMGFGVPIATWLRRELRDWAADLITPDRLKREGYLAPRLIQRAWEDHQRGRVDNSHLLWGVLMFQAWLAEQ